ncbi:MAG: ABC transporter ATP-binding protein [Egibacteraceae bacterium]
MRLSFAGVGIEIGGTPIVHGVSAAVEAGEMVGLIGPNGSGKSTLLRSVYRHLKPTRGVVWVGPDDVWALKARDAARRTAAVPQERPEEFDVTVAEVIAAGRIPHKGAFSPDGPTDRRVIAAAAERVGMTGFMARRFSTLSGGEKQRALIARALAQESQLLVLDEPTNHLDLRHQLEVLDLIHGLGLTTLVALHDLNLAAMYCDRLHVMSAGRVVRSGQPEDVLTERMLEEVFGVGADIALSARTGKLSMSVYPLAAKPAGARPPGPGDTRPLTQGHNR